MSLNIDDLIKRVASLAACKNEIMEVLNLLTDTFRAGGKILLCGNGGSAADCEHWAGELLKSFVKDRPLPAELASKLPADIAQNLEAALPAIPLTGFLSASTAFANDVAPQLIFAQLTLGLGKPGDVLIGISTSGNAVNVCQAARVAKALGIKTVALTGKTGGELAKLTDIAIRVPETETYKIQELHLAVYHWLCLAIEDELF
jgi:D-sedoheptulose 7-phosphate isomerase